MDTAAMVAVNASCLAGCCDRMDRLHEDPVEPANVVLIIAVKARLIE